MAVDAIIMAAGRGVKMKLKIFLAVFVALMGMLIVMDSVFGLRYEINEFKYGITHTNGAFEETSTPLTDTHVIGFVCSSANCATVSAALDLSNGQVISDINNAPVLNSGNSDNLTLVYPTTLQSSYGYGVYVFKDDYIPWGFTADYWGTNPADPQGPFDNFPSRKESCFAPIVNFTVLNDVYKNLPLIVDVNATLDADTFSAIRSAGPLDYAPPQLLDQYYSVNTSVTLVIRNSNNDIVHTNTTYMLIPYSSSKHIRFTWTPAVEGTYNASVITGVPDAKCLQDSVIPQSQSKFFNVWATAPKNACYTLINGLSYSPEFGEAGKQMNFAFNKISNYANNYDIWDSRYDLTPVSTWATYLIKNSTDDTVFIQTTSLPANPNNSTPVTFKFSWTPTIAGDYTTLVSGISDDVKCLTVSNPQDTETTTLRVSEIILDILLPSITVLHPANGQAFAVPIITVNGTASDNVGLSKVEIKVGSGAWQLAEGTSTWSKSVTLAQGSNTVYARATDTSGNIKEVSRTVSYSPPDTTTPAQISDFAAGSPTQDSITLTWTAPGDDGNSGQAFDYSMRYSTSEITEANWESAIRVQNVPEPKPAGSSESFTITGLSPSTKYFFGIKAKDDSGNEAHLSNIPNATTLSGSESSDTIPPVLSNILAAPTTDSATISWTTDEPANSTVVFGTSNPKAQSAANATLSGSHSVLLSGLIPNTPYIYNVTSCDASGNCNTSLEFSFTTLSTGGGSPPVAATSGGGGGGGGNYFKSLPTNNKYAYFANVSIPDSINVGEQLPVTGCVEKLGKNGTVDIYIDNKPESTINVSPKTKCFNSSKIMSTAGKHIVYLWFNESGADFSKTVNVIANESVEETEKTEVKILDISINGSVTAGVPATIKVSMRALGPSEVSLTLFAGDTEIGRKQAYFDGDATFAFNYTFDKAGNITLKATAQTKEGYEDTLIKKIEVKKGMPTGSFFSRIAENPGAVAAIIAVIAGAGYYAHRKGYLLAMKSRMHEWWTKRPNKIPEVLTTMKSRIHGWWASLRHKQEVAQ